ncbi:MAG: hypothetical protein H8D45_02210 [Bacteroidetes bacterium]|nr:hypothetical protein [Bacteroidota bacterium]
MNRQWTILKGLNLNNIRPACLPDMSGDRQASRRAGWTKNVSPKTKRRRCLTREHVTGFLFSEVTPKI